MHACSVIIGWHVIVQRSLGIWKLHLMMSTEDLNLGVMFPD